MDHYHRRRLKTLTRRVWVWVWVRSIDRGDGDGDGKQVVEMIIMRYSKMHFTNELIGINTKKKRGEMRKISLILDAQKY